ncbi:hypothetical protein [Streptomyces sp. NPDC006645]|uniref:hypothetical protein n=1 Tax=unclassified Streptomyces TaxID=2593676 RepID=UPI0033BC97B3
MTAPALIRLRGIVEQSAVALTDAVREQLARDDLDPGIRAPALDTPAQSLVTGFGEHRYPRRMPDTGVRPG